MSVIKSLVIAFSMYSKIPMPHLELEEKDMYVPSSPYSRFIIFLQNHRMVLIKNESVSPGCISAVC